ncbi:MAG: hypothetical protein K0Q92_3156 [Steroidobacteraceae bacterium]|nr:hypothetical protein [Steroidobacteraceae bacterium]
MRLRYFDFSSWQGVLSTLFGLAIITLLGVGIRLLVMQTVQQRRERENRQINERLRTLIAAYKTLGGSFTGDLAVDPTHLREMQRRVPAPAGDPALPAARPVHTHELVVSLRGFIRQVLDLEPIPASVTIPNQGPARPGGAKPEKGDGRGQDRGGGNKGTGGDMAAGAGAGMGLGLGAGMTSGEAAPDRE